MNIADRIKAAQETLAAKKDRLVVESTKMTDNPTDEAQINIVDQLSLEVEGDTKSLESLQRAERALLQQAAPAIIKQHGTKAVDGLGLFVKAAICHLTAKAEGTSVQAVLGERYKNDEQVAAVLKAASPASPAQTDVTGWAKELLNEARRGMFIDLLKPASILGGLGLVPIDFGNAPSIYMPVRNDVAHPNDMAGTFVGEGAPIRVGGMNFGSISLTPKKLGIIGVYTSEMMERSNPAIEAIVRQAMIDDTSEGLDKAFVSGFAGSAIQPAGIAHNLGATGDTRVSAGNTIDNIITDLRAMVAGLTDNLLGKAPVWVMNPARATGLGFATDAIGNFVFRAEMSNGRLLGYPLVISTNCPAGEVYLIDTAYETWAAGAPVFSATNQATVHMEQSEADVKPIVGGTAASAAPAAPVRSMYQTDSLALRTIWYTDWAKLRAHAVQQLTAAAW
jgi:HK97 family phage major capsid protein